MNITGYVEAIRANTFVNLVAERLIELLMAPRNYPDMIWMVIPLVFTLIIMQFYFGRYNKDELGWNTAVGNTLVLFFVCIDLLRHIYNYSGTFVNFFVYPVKTTVALGVGVAGVMLFFADFFRFLPKQLAFIVSSPLSVNLIGYTAMCIVYSNVVADRYTAFAGLALYFVLFFFVHVLRFIIYEIWGLNTA